MDIQKRLPLDERVADVAKALATARYQLGRDAEPQVYLYDVASALERGEAALAEVWKLLDESREARERAADVPDDGNLADLLAWVEAGAYRARWLLTAFEHMLEETQILQEAPAAGESRAWQIKHVIAQLGLVKDAAEAHEGYEAVTALERAITCLHMLNTEKEQTTQRHRKWAIREYDRDEHGAGCMCGLCNSNGHAWGMAIYDVSALDQALLENSEALGEALRKMDPVEVVYAPQPDTSDRAAKAWVEQHGGWYGDEPLNKDE